MKADVRCHSKASASGFRVSWAQLKTLRSEGVPGSGRAQPGPRGPAVAA